MADQEGATQTGVPAIPDLNDPNVRVDRAAGMAAMAARRRETVQTEMDGEFKDQFVASIAGTTPATNTADPDDTSATDAAAEAERARLQAESDAAEQARLQARVDAGNQIDRAGAAAEPPPDPSKRRVLSEDDLDNTYVRVKVRGVEEEISLREQRARAQKTSAADTYLEEARETLRQVKEIAAAVTPRSQVDAQTTAAPNGTQSGDGSTTTAPSPARAAIQALFQGDEDQAVANLERLAAKATPAEAPKPNVDALASQVEARLVVRRAVTEFSRAHKQLVDDPIARDIANRFIAAELQREGVEELAQLPADTMQAVLTRAGTSTSNYFRSMSGLAPAPTPVIDKGLNRTAAKEAQIEPTTAGTRASTSVAPPATPSDVIARMQASRQPQVNPTRR